MMLTNEQFQQLLGAITQGSVAVSIIAVLYLIYLILRLVLHWKGKPANGGRSPWEPRALTIAPDDETKGYVRRIAEQVESMHDDVHDIERNTRTR